LLFNAFCKHKMALKSFIQGSPLFQMHSLFRVEKRRSLEWRSSNTCDIVNKGAQKPPRWPQLNHRPPDSRAEALDRISGVTERPDDGPLVSDRLQRAASIRRWTEASRDIKFFSFSSQVLQVCFWHKGG
jgi:hypothetical protein